MAAWRCRASESTVCDPAGCLGGGAAALDPLAPLTAAGLMAPLAAAGLMAPLAAAGLIKPVFSYTQITAKVEKHANSLLALFSI